MADVDYDSRPDRPCVGCGQYDKAPRDQVALPDGNSALYHMDCHILVANCQVCKDVLATAGGHSSKGKKNEELFKHLTSLDKRDEEVFTSENVADDGVVPWPGKGGK